MDLFAKFQNRDAEEAVLGSILLDPDALFEVTDHIRPEDMYQYQNRLILQACIDLSKAGTPIDAITVDAQLERGEFEVDITYLVGLSAAVPTALNAGAYAKIVKEMAVKRNATTTATRLLNSLSEADAHPQETIAEAGVALANLALDQQSRKSVYTAGSGMRDFLDDLFERVEDAGRGETYRRVIPTGLSDLDRLLDGGPETSNYILLGGVPGMGKTALMLALSRNMAAAGNSVCFFSLEQNNKALHRRNISSMTGIPAGRLKRGSLTDAEYSLVLQKTQEFADLNYTVIDDTRMTPSKIRTHIQRLIAKGEKPSVCFFDYLGLISPDNVKDDSTTAMVRASGALREMAKEFDILFVVAAQLLHKDINKRTNPKPVQGDIFGSAQPEKDCDVEFFIYRPSKYFPGEDPDRVDLIMVKNREGTVDEVEIAWDPMTFTFRDKPRRAYAPPSMKANPAYAAA